MSPTKVVKSGTCETFHLDLGHEMIKRSPQKEAACPVLHLHCWHKFGRYPSKKIWYIYDNRYDLSFYLFDFEFVSGVGEHLAFPWISLHLRRMDRVIWGGERFENTLSKKLRKSAMSIRRSGEVSQQVVLVSGLCAGFAKIWAEDHTVVVTQWIPPLLPEAFEKPRHAWRGGKNAWRGFLLSQVPQLYCIPK